MAEGGGGNSLKRKGKRKDEGSELGATGGR